MTEKQLKKLGFKKNKVTKEESGDKPYYYYTLVVKGISFITNAIDKNVDISVGFFNFDSVDITDFEDLSAIISGINNKTKTEKENFIVNFLNWEDKNLGSTYPRTRENRMYAKEYLK